MPTPESSGITAIVHFTTKIGGVKKKLSGFRAQFSVLRNLGSGLNKKGFRFQEGEFRTRNIVKYT
jgi:hypothetical protein